MGDPPMSAKGTMPVPEKKGGGAEIYGSLVD